MATSYIKAQPVCGIKARHYQMRFSKSSTQTLGDMGFSAVGTNMFIVFVPRAVWSNTATMYAVMQTSSGYSVTYMGGNKDNNLVVSIVDRTGVVKNNSDDSITTEIYVFEAD